MCPFLYLDSQMLTEFEMEEKNPQNIGIQIYIKY